MKSMGKGQEQEGVLFVHDRPARRRPTPLWRPAAAAVLTCLLLVAVPYRLGFLPACARHAQSTQERVPNLASEVKWPDIPASRNFSWHACYGGDYECARLDVPLDWLDPTDDERAVLAVVRLPAVNRSDYRGPVFFNPGGPGGSGIWSIRDHGKLLQKVVGDNHDIISFDPRGIGASVPRIECWDSVQKQHFWDLQDVGVVDAHPGILNDAFARMGAYSQNCEDAMGRSGILRHSGTASHARDLLEMLHQLGEEKLKYWGFSYGTVLGGTFAAMYPDKIERFVSDGNVDLREWYEKVHTNFLRDTDKVMQAFFDLCHRAGPATCAFYAASPAAIKARLQSLVERVRRYPIIVSSDEERGPDIPEVITYSRLKRFISSTLYQPQYAFPRFAEIVLALEEGNGRPFYERLVRGNPAASAVCQAETTPPTVPLTGVEEGNDDAFPAIMCADSVPLSPRIEDMEAIVKELEEMSYAAGAVNVLFPISCAGRTIRPKWRYSGPFEGNTSFPILFVANIADNVTPLISARNNSAGFPSSVILVQNSYGHTSLSAPSTCTAKWIRGYFQQGVLPPPNETCEPDVLPFGLPAATTADVSDLSSVIAELSRRAGATIGARRARSL